MKINLKTQDFREKIFLKIGEIYNVNYFDSNYFYQLISIEMIPSRNKEQEKDPRIDLKFKKYIKKKTRNLVKGAKEIHSIDSYLLSNIDKLKSAISPAKDLIQKEIDDLKLLYSQV